MRRFLGAAALLGLLGLPFFATTEVACSPQGQCDSSLDYLCLCGDPKCHALLLDNDTTWVSGPLEGKWLTFPRERTWHLEPRDPTGRRLRGRITSVEFTISATEMHDQGANIGGNNAQWKLFPDQSIDVQNDTCQDYFVYVVIHSSLDDAGPNTCPTACDGGLQYAECSDAGKDAAAATDASNDAAPDTGTDQ